VLKVTKEKTARIIPNAVGIATLHEKHVFSSLLSRDSTYKLMVQVWKNATAPEIIEVIPIEPIPLLIPTVSKFLLSLAFELISIIQIAAENFVTKLLLLDECF